MFKRRSDSINNLVDVFDNTVDLCWDNKVLSDSVEYTIENSILYKPDSCELIGTPSEEKCVVTVTKERTFECAGRLHKENPDYRIAVHNFASATNPGGGVVNGARAQEECLCRCSTLYQCLNIDDFIDDYYNMHRRLKDLRYTDTCIYCPDIIVFKTDTKMPELMDEKDWFKVDVLTCPAPNLRKFPNNKMNPGASKQMRITDSELLEIHKKRARHILNIAVENKADAVILGAFGCGAFSNNPEVVAKAYKEILPEYMGYFKVINFAVYCPPNDMTNYNAFNSALGSI